MNWTTTNNTDAIILQDEILRRYTSGIYTSQGLIVIFNTGEKYYITDGRYIEMAREKLSDFTVLDSTTDKEIIKKTCTERLTKTPKIGFSSERTSFDEYNNLQKKHPNSEFISIDEFINNARASKTDEELKYMQKAQEIAEAALSNVVSHCLRPGTTEKQIAAELIYQMLILGADDVSFPPIVASGKNSSMPHAVPTDKPLQNGEFVVIDFGCKYNGYCSDMTRTLSVGNVTPEMQTVYNIVLDAQKAGILAAKAGVLGKEIDNAAREVIASAGYGEYFTHSFGHSLGLEIHEKPNANQKENTPMPLNTVISAEPGIYITGKFGVRIEDVIVLKNNGNINLTKFQK